jgi:transposase
MNAYATDLRLRMLAAVDRDVAYPEISRLFGVSLATIGRYIKRSTCSARSDRTSA